MKWFFSPHKSNKKAVEVVRNHKVMVSAFFLLSHLLSWLFHVINSSDNTCFIFIFLDRFFFTGWDEMEFRISNCKVKVAIRDHFFSYWNAPMWLKKSCFISLSPYMLVCVLIYVVCFVTSLAHLRSGLNYRQLFWWLSIILYFFSPLLCHFFPVCACESVLVVFFETCARARVCVCQVHIFYRIVVFWFSHWLLYNLLKIEFVLLCSASVFLINSPFTLGKVIHSLFSSVSAAYWFSFLF
jgi:hypothetical protein